MEVYVDSGTGSTWRLCVVRDREQDGIPTPITMTGPDSDAKDRAKPL